MRSNVRCVTEERKTASIRSKAEWTLSTWSWYFKENHSLARWTTTFCLVLQSRYMFVYASPRSASFVFACSCGRTFTPVFSWIHADKSLERRLRASHLTRAPHAIFLDPHWWVHGVPGTSMLNDLLLFYLAYVSCNCSFFIFSSHLSCIASSRVSVRTLTTLHRTTSLRCEKHARCNTCLRVISYFLCCFMRQISRVSR